MGDAIRRQAECKEQLTICTRKRAESSLVMSIPLLHASPVPKPYNKNSDPPTMKKSSKYYKYMANKRGEMERKKVTRLACAVRCTIDPAFEDLVEAAAVDCLPAACVESVAVLLMLL